MEQNNDERLTNYPRHVQAFAKAFNGRLPQECDYHGYKKYRKRHIFGKTQKDVDEFINWQNYIRKNAIILLALIKLLYIPAMVYGAITHDFILVFIFACVLIVHIAFCISEICQKKNVEKQLKDKLFFVVIDED